MCQGAPAMCVAGAPFFVRRCFVKILYALLPRIGLFAAKRRDYLM